MVKTYVPSLEPSIQLDEKERRQLSDARLRRDHMEYGSLVERLGLQGFIETDEVGVELYTTWLAEEARDAQQDGALSEKPRTPLAVWEGGRIPLSVKGLRLELRRYHEANDLPLPLEFWEGDKKALQDMYLGIVEDQKKKSG